MSDSTDEAVAIPVQGFKDPSRNDQLRIEKLEFDVRELRQRLDNVVERSAIIESASAERVQALRSSVDGLDARLSRLLEELRVRASDTERRASDLEARANSIEEGLRALHDTVSTQEKAAQDRHRDLTSKLARHQDRLTQQRSALLTLAVLCGVGVIVAVLALNWWRRPLDVALQSLDERDREHRQHTDAEMIDLSRRLDTEVAARTSAHTEHRERLAQLTDDQAEDRAVQDVLTEGLVSLTSDAVDTELSLGRELSALRSRLEAPKTAPVFPRPDQPPVLLDDDGTDLTCRQATSSLTATLKPGRFAVGIEGAYEQRGTRCSKASRGDYSLRIPDEWQSLLALTTVRIGQRVGEFYGWDHQHQDVKGDVVYLSNDQVGFRVVEHGITSRLRAGSRVDFARDLRLQWTFELPVRQ